MKKIFLIPMIIFLVTTGCKKDPVISSTPTTIQPPPQPPPPPPLPPVTPEIIPLTAFAGLDVRLTLPVNSCVLFGSSNYANTYSWRKVAGPTSYTIDSPQSQKINVSNLEKGIYEFELTVTASGLSGKDTVTVDVYEPQIIAGSNEFTFKNLVWIFPWYAAIEVKNIDTYNQANRPIKKVFVQRDFDSTWIEINQITSSWTNQQYEYFIETRLDGAGMYTYRSLYIFYYGNNTTDSPNVKFQF